MGGLLVTGCRTGPPSRDDQDRKSAEKSSRQASVPDEQAVQIAAEAHAHYAAGVIHDLNGDTEAALGEFYQASLKDPEDEDLTLEISSRLLQNKQPEKALLLLQAAAKRSNASGDILARLGAVYTRLDRNQEALAANQLAVKKSPRSLAGYRNLFFNYLQTKQTTEALKILDQAAKQSNPGAGFLIGVSGLYAQFAHQYPSQRQAVNAKTMAVLARAEKLKPTGVHLRLQLADGFFLAGAMDKAATNYLGVLDQLADLPQARDMVRDRLTKIYLREGDRKRAREQLEAIVRDDPSNAQAYYFLGLVAHEEQRWADMADCLSKTLLFSPHFEPAYYDLAVAQIAQDKPDEALATLATAAKKFPQNFKLEYWRGVANNQAKNYLQAVKHLSAAEFIAQTTDTNLLTQAFYLQLGAAFQRQGDRTRARTYFEKSLKLQPDFEPAYYDLANVLLELGETGEALATLETAKSKFPQSFLLEYLFGAAQRQKKNFAEAVRHLKAAEAIAQTGETNRLTYHFYFDMGAACERKGDYAQAEVYFEKCLALKPDFSEAQNYLGYMWAERGEKLERAHQLIEQALKAQPQNAAYLDSMGWVLFKQNRLKEALEYILKAAELSKEPDATLFDHLGDIYAALKEMDKAGEAWRKSLAVEKNDAVQKKLEASKQE